MTHLVRDLRVRRAAFALHLLCDPHREVLERAGLAALLARLLHTRALLTMLLSAATLAIRLN